MVKKEEIINQFYGQAWKIVQLMKKSRTNKKFHYQWLQEEHKLYDILKQLPDRAENATYRDISDFFVGILLYTDKQSIDDVTYDDLKRSLDKRVFGQPYIYEFYFRLGQTSGFPDGYQLGNGELYSFDKLPAHVRKHISGEWKYEYRDNKEYARTLKEYEEYRKKDWCMHIAVSSVGWNKAIEKAIQIARRNLNIYKLVYFTESYHEHIVGPRPPLDYYFGVNKGSRMGGANVGEPFRSTIFRVQSKSLDGMISDINSIISKANPTELENRILNAIDAFGMIDESTPLHVRFMLCIIGLEGLLLSKGDRDYLGWKLAEKITFLLADSPAWNATTYNIGPENKNVLTKKFIAKRLVESRIRLNKEVRDLYDKRSSFAHRGIGKKNNEEITPDNYSTAYLILRWAVEKLLELRNNGITHIAKEKGIDINSLDGYIEKLKYN